MNEQSIKPFSNGTERGYLRGAHSEAESALALNPGTTLKGLIAACEARASTLHLALDMWARIPVDVGDAQELAESLLPTAEELKILLNELGDMQAVAVKKPAQ